MLLLLLWMACGARLSAPQAVPLPAYTDAQLLDEVEHRAFRFFWECADANTGLVNDRAANFRADDHTIASIASTGYGLAALPIAVKRGWVTRAAAEQRATITLRFLRDKMPEVHGWYYHFVDRATGERVWNCELSSIDTALLLVGALTCGQYFRGTEVERLADAIYDRVDWTWMRTDGGTQPDKLTLSMGWRPEKGFLPNEWDHYCELMLLYLLGLGSRRDPLPAASWAAWQRNVVEYGGRKTLAGGPIFMHQMAHAYYDFHDCRDGLGWDYRVSSVEATHINRQYCLDRAGTRKTYAPNVWGLNAS